jgi:retron-type reverse transcriptase
MSITVSSCQQNETSNPFNQFVTSIKCSFELDYDLTKCDTMAHDGCCGYYAIMQFMGLKSSMKEFTVNVLNE